MNKLFVYTCISNKKGHSTVIADQLARLCCKPSLPSQLKKSAGLLLWAAPSAQLGPYLAWASCAVLLVFVVILIYRQKLLKQAHEAEISEITTNNNKLKAQSEKDLQEKIKQQEDRLAQLTQELAEVKNEDNAQLMKHLVEISIAKGELIAQANQVLEKALEKDKQKWPEKQIKQLTKALDELSAPDEAWAEIKEAFLELHPTFFETLQTMHPKLTTNDLRLCAYLRMNLSSKDIAPMLNISVKSVEVNRYRLRKKLDLPRDIRLIDYILTIKM